MMRSASKKPVIGSTGSLPLIFMLAMTLGCAKPSSDSGMTADGGHEEAPSGNLLANPGFDSGDTHFTPWVLNIHADPGAYEFTLDNAIARDGSYSLHVRKIRDEPFASVVQYFRKSQLASSRYRLSVWFRGNDLDSPAYLHAAFTRFGGQFALVDNRDEGLSGTFDWTRLDMEIDMPAQFDSAEIGISTTGNGEIWIDAAELVPLTE